MAADKFANCRNLPLLQPEREKMLADFAEICSEFTAKLPVRLHLSIHVPSGFEPGGWTRNAPFEWHEQSFLGAGKQ
jgi:hypothetical protein